MHPDYLGSLSKEELLISSIEDTRYLILLKNGL